MNLNRYTEKAQEAILAAQQARRTRADIPRSLPEHLLLALVDAARRHRARLCSEK